VKVGLEMDDRLRNLFFFAALDANVGQHRLALLQAAGQHRLAQHVIALDEFDFGVQLLFADVFLDLHVVAALRSDHRVDALAFDQNLGHRLIFGRHQQRSHECPQQQAAE